MEKINIEKLQTIKNYAKAHNVTTTYIYKLIKSNKMQHVVIDGVQFIQSDVYTSIPIENRRK
jgi:predicted ATP-dependent serine protease